MNTVTSIAQRQKRNGTGFTAIGASNSAECPGVSTVTERAICAACVKEIFDPFQRRYRYPFAHCGECGSCDVGVAHEACPACQAERHDPDDRRHGDILISCHACGPKLRLRRSDDRPVAFDTLSMLDEADAACTLLQRGQVLAIRSPGGYLLACDATQPDAVAGLRKGQGTARKPYAMLARDIVVVRRYCQLSEAEAALLSGPAVPVVVLDCRGTTPSPHPPVAENVAPGLASYGFRLPDTALLHLVMRRMEHPVVVTRGKCAGNEAVMTPDQARLSLGGIATYFLEQDGPGAPLPKRTVLRMLQGRPHRLRGAPDLSGVTAAMPSGVESLAPVQARGVGRVQRHHALTAACLMDNGVPLDASPVLSIVLDTPASGDDGTLWGGEFLLAEYGRFRRLGTFRPIACPGRHMDASQPWQTLLAHILAQMGWPTFAMNYAELELFAFLSARIEARPADQVDLRSVSSACAPWFDAVAAAMGLCRLNLEYPGQSIAELEAAVDRDCLENEDDALSYPFAIPRLPNGLPYVEPLACWQALFGDLLLDTPLGVMAARFHRGLAKTLVRMADRLIREAGREGAPIANIALIGRVFQNRILFSCVESQLQALGHVVLGHAQTACHDDSVLVGRTLVAAARQMGTN